jgi:hypothetical protein
MAADDSVIINGILVVVRKEFNVADFKVVYQHLYGEAK